MIFSKRKTIGVFTSKIFKPFDDAFFKALDRESKRLDYDIVVFTTAGYYITSTDYDMQEKNILQFAPVHMMDGIIAVPSTYEKGLFRELLDEMLKERVHCPMVIVREYRKESDCVYTDNVQAVRLVMKHLIEDHGLKKICMQAGDFEAPEIMDRMEAFRLEMEAHDLPYSDDSFCTGNMWTSSGDIAYEAFFSNKYDIPEAVVCGNDYMAYGLIRVLRKNGYRVPEDVIVTGFDNVTDWAIDVPSLTTIQPDYDGMVTEAMNILDRQIRGKEKAGDGPVHIGLKGTLVHGESCGCGKRTDNFYRELAGRTISQLEAANDQDAAMNNLSIDLGACDDMTQLHNVMTSRRTDSPIVRDNYICLFGTPEDMLNQDGDTACLIHAERDHLDCGMPMISFKKDHLLPPMAEREDEAQLFYVKLLHQNRHNFGYSMTHYDEGAVPSRCFVETNVLLSIALENIYRRNELMRLYEERRLSSITDMLTGLLNRRGINEHLEPQWMSLTGHDIAFVCIDMDRLKHINDTYGHSAGDFAIHLVGRAIHASMPGQAVGARIGGDEFIVFLPDAGNGGAEEYVASFEKTLRRLNETEKRSFNVSASAGFVVRKLTKDMTIDECIHASDQAMYKIKEKRHQEMDKTA